MTKRAGEAILSDLVGMITKHLRSGVRVQIAGLGILQVRKRAARTGRNPATGEAIKIKASKKVGFGGAKDLKMAVETQYAVEICPVNESWRGGLSLNRRKTVQITVGNFYCGR